MSGRYAKPVDLHLYDGKKHLTKQEIEDRRKGEIKLGDKNFLMPVELRGKKHGENKFFEIVKIFEDSDLDLVSSSDIGIISRYCIVYDDYVNLNNLITQMDSNEILMLDVETYIKLQNTANKKNDILTKLEDRLFLNPLSKIKTVPVKKKEVEETELEKEGFGGV